MRTILNSFLIISASLLLSSCMGLQGGAYAQGNYGNDNYNDGYYSDNNDGYNNGDVNFQDFYNELAPHGRWINDRNYGNVWIPNVGRNFHPYATDGYWAMTDYGNTWVSNYNWGWAPFHYGRWYMDEYYGWAWVPDYEWAPAWVSWRSGGGYYGWAPLSPRMGNNVYVELPSLSWVFLSNQHMYNHNMHRHYNRYSSSIYNRTTIINNTNIYNDNRYYSGPSSQEYYKNTGNRVSVRKLESANRPGRSSVSDRSVSIYRPESRGSVNNSNRNSNVNRSSSNQNRATEGRSNSNVQREAAPTQSRNSGVQRQAPTQSRNSGVQRQAPTQTRSNNSSASQSTSSSSKRESATSRSNSGNTRSTRSSR